MLTTISLFEVGFLVRIDLLTRSDGLSSPNEKLNNEIIAKINTNDIYKK